MNARSNVTAEIEAALEAQPDNVPLRLHLVTLLLVEENQAAQALEHCATVLAREPGNIAALELAARAAEAAGEDERAGQYRGQLATLKGDEGAPNDEEAPDADDADDDSGAEIVPLRVVAGGRGPDHDAAGETGEVERPKITLADVGGMEPVKRQLNLSFLAPLRNPEYRKMYGKSLRGGLLLYGPPGCGKTFIGRATAGELEARFLSVGLTDVIDMYMGESEKNLAQLFDLARRNAPCVLFLDEVDAIGQKRSHLRHSGMRSVVNALLAELDNAEKSNEGVYVLAATNHPWDVDAALKRPGRLDRTLLVLPPDLPARAAIFEFHLRERPVENIDIAGLARKTDGFSGADIAHLCETATELAMEAAIDTGDAKPIAMAHFKSALKAAKPSTGAWFETAKNYALYANEGGAYDELLAYLRRR